MTIKDLRLYLEPWPEDYEVRVHVGTHYSVKGYHSTVRFVGVCAPKPGAMKVVFIEVDSDREYDI